MDTPVGGKVVEALYGSDLNSRRWVGMGVGVVMGVGVRMGMLLRACPVRGEWWRVAWSGVPKALSNAAHARARTALWLNLTSLCYL